MQFDRDDNYEANKQEFILGQKEVRFQKAINYGQLILEKETETNRAILQLFIRVE